MKTMKEFIEDALKEQNYTAVVRTKTALCNNFMKTFEGGGWKEITFKGGIGCDRWSIYSPKLRATRVAIFAKENNAVEILYRVSTGYGRARAFYK